MGVKVKRNKTRLKPSPTFRCALCYGHTDRPGIIGFFCPHSRAVALPYMLCATCAKTVGRNMTPAQMARIESYISS